MNEQLYSDPYALYEGYELLGDPSGLNIPEILRMRKMWKCYDMKEFGEYRYNLFEPEHHWFAGNFATPGYVEKIDISKVPENIPRKYYVDSNCVYCETCIELAPENFASQDDEYAYVKKQPEDEAEEDACQASMASCPSDAIGDDGE